MKLLLEDSSVLVLCALCQGQFVRWILFRAFKFQLIPKFSSCFLPHRFPYGALTLYCCCIIIRLGYLYSTSASD